MGLIQIGSGTPEDQMPRGTYPGALTAVGTKEIEVKNSQFGKNGLRSFFEWTFALDGTEDENGELFTVTGLTSDATGPKSNTFKYVSALLGNVEIGTELDPEDLIGKRALISVGLNEAGYNIIEDVVAAPTAAPARRRPTAVPAAATVAEKSEPAEEADEDDLPF